MAGISFMEAADKDSSSPSPLSPPAAPNHWSPPPPATAVASLLIERSGSSIRSRVPVDLVSNSKPLWSSCVIGHFLNDPPHIGKVHATVNRLWRPKDEKLLIDAQFLNATSVLFRIPSDRSRDWVLKKQFWYIGDSSLVVQKWTPQTAGSKPDLSCFPVWIDFHEVPDHLFSHKGLTFLGNLVGNFQRIHPKTERCLRLDVARVMATIDLEKQLPTKIVLQEGPEDADDFEIKVSFPWLPKHCSNCTRWGHDSLNCPVSDSLNCLVSDSITSAPIASQDPDTVLPAPASPFADPLASPAAAPALPNSADATSPVLAPDNTPGAATVANQAEPATHVPTVETIEGQHLNETEGWIVVASNSRGSPVKLHSPKSLHVSSSSSTIESSPSENSPSRFEVLSTIIEDCEKEEGEMEEALGLSESDTERIILDETLSSLRKKKKPAKKHITSNMGFTKFSAKKQFVTTKNKKASSGKH